MKFITIFVVGLAVFASSDAFFSKLVNKAVNIQKEAVGKLTDVAKSAVDTTASIQKGALNKLQDVTTNTLATAKSVAGSTASTLKAGAEFGVNSLLKVSMLLVNPAVEFMLLQFRTAMKVKSNGTVALDNLNTTVGPLKLTAVDGYVSDLSTTQLSGEVTAVTNGTSIVVDFPIKLETIEVGYKDFNVTVWFVKQRGGIKVTVGENEINTRIIIKPGLTCIVNVESVNVTKFDDLKVDFYNMNSGVQWVLDQLSNLLVTTMKGTIRQKVQNAIDENLRKLLAEDGTICSKFVGQ